MSNVLDLVDQTFFRVERATGITSLIQCVWMYDRAIDIDGLRRFHRHLQRGRLSRRIERSPLPFGRHRWVSPSDQSDLEIVATPRPREEFDAWLDEQANTPPGCRARTRMAPRGAAVHRRRRGGELGRLTLPHRRRRVVRGVGGRGLRLRQRNRLARCRVTPAVAGRARGRPPNRARHPRHRPRPRRRSPARFARRNRGSAGSATPAACPVRRSRRTHHAPNGNDLRRCRRVGRPRGMHSEGPATRCSRHWPPASPSEWDESPQTARSP